MQFLGMLCDVVQIYYDVILNPRAWPLWFRRTAILLFFVSIPVYAVLWVAGTLLAFLYLMACAVYAVIAGLVDLWNTPNVPK